MKPSQGNASSHSSLEPKIKTMTKLNRPLARSLRDMGHSAFFACLLLILAACGGAEGAASVSSPNAGPTTSGVTPVAAVVTTPEPQPDAPFIPPAELDIETLRHSTYQGVLDEAVTLADGRFEGEPFVAGGASRPIVTLLPEPVAFGDLDGDGQAEAAVILVFDAGGSGSFVYLAAVEARDGVADNVATLLLGDRVQVKALDIEGGRLVARLLTHAPDDPACCPTLEKTLTLRLSDNQLQEIGE